MNDADDSLQATAAVIVYSCRNRKDGLRKGLLKDAPDVGDNCKYADTINDNNKA